MRRGKNLFKWINISLVFLLLFNPSYVTNAAIQESQSTTDISQWSIHSGADLLSISNEKQVEGTSSLRFEAVPDSLTDLYSAQIDVEGGKEYRVSANVNMTEQVSHSLGFYLVSYDDNGTEIDSHRQGFTADHFPLDEWTDVSFNVGVPVNTASVRIRMYTGSVTDMVAFIDHIQLFEIESSGEQVEIPVPNGSFGEEGSVDPDDP